MNGASPRSSRKFFRFEALLGVQTDHLARSRNISERIAGAARKCRFFQQQAALLLQIASVFRHCISASLIRGRCQQLVAVLIGSIFIGWRPPPGDQRRTDAERFQRYHMAHHVTCKRGGRQGRRCSFAAHTTSRIYGRDRPQTTSKMTQKVLHLPDFMANWPWPRRIHPLYEDVSAESIAWLRSLAPFDPESQLAFEKCNFGLLAALGYPDVSGEHLRMGMDLMNVFFVIDEYTDIQPATTVREMADIVIDALNNPQKPRPSGEMVLGELVRQFAERGLRTATAEATSHFLKDFTEYMESVVLEAEDRCNGATRSIEEFVRVRRLNNGGRPSLSPCELHLSIPDEVFYHPHIVELRDAIVDMITAINDVLSYNREQATENDHFNLVTVVMRELNVDLDSAIAWITQFHDDLAERFKRGLERVPAFGPEVDGQLHEYLRSIVMWPRCVDNWSYEAGRYFGDQSLEVQRTRRVPLLPRRKRCPEQVQGEVQVYSIERLAEPIAA
ncbi:terpenoid synthase [Trametes cingulata]|nr:terpenoid synthase [Trametes cingulata]